MYSIGSFSKISNTPIQTLRYYDRLSLLKPNIVGKYNNYRYYSDEQLSRLSIIKRLKKIGFKLNEISDLINNYDEKVLFNQKKRLDKEISNKYCYIREIENIIRKKRQNPNIQLLNLMNNEERRIDMKERYEETKGKLLKCYDLYNSKDQDNFLVNLEELKNNIFNSENESDPFWMNGAGDLFTGIVYEMFKNNLKEQINFLNIFQFRVDGKENIDDITSYVEKLSGDSYSYMCLSSVSKAPKDTRDSIIYVFKQVMKPYSMFDTKN